MKIRAVSFVGALYAFSALAAAGAAAPSSTDGSKPVLLSDIRRKWGSHIPAVLGGDLNSRTKSSAHEMLRQGGFMNADATADIRSPHSSHHGNPRRGEDGKYHGSLRAAKDDNPSSSIDHIYCTKGIHAFRHEIVTDQSVLDVSDHSPVLVEFTIEK